MQITPHFILAQNYYIFRKHYRLNNMLYNILSYFKHNIYNISTLKPLLAIKYTFRNVSKTTNETFYLHISKNCCNFVPANAFPICKL